MKKLRERATESQLGPRSFSRLCDQGRPPSQVSRTKTQGSKVFASRVSGPDLSTVGRPPDQARGGFLEAGLGLGELALHLVLDRLRLFRVNLGLFLVRCVKAAQLRYFQGNSMVGMVLMYVTTLGWLVDVLLAQIKYHVLRCANAFMWGQLADDMFHSTVMDSFVTSGAPRRSSAGAPSPEAERGARPSGGP